MRKCYVLSMFVALVMSGNLRAQGVSCEKATPWTGMCMGLSAADYPDGAWYGITVENPSMLSFNGLIGITTDDVHVYEGCNGNEAYVMTEDAGIGNKAFYLESGIEYKLRLTLPADADYVFAMSSTLDMSRAPEGSYCVKPIVITEDEYGVARNLNAGTTWFRRDLAYAAPVSITVRGSESGNTAEAVTQVVTRHLDCNGGENVSSELFPTRAYAKAGTNLIGITASEPCEVLITLDAISAAGCNNHPAYAAALSLGVESTYANAYYTVDRRFVVPETGTYTFTNYGAEGTILSIGLLTETNVCDFESKPLEATVGADHLATVTSSFNEGDVVMVRSDAYGVLEGGLPYLKVEKGGSGIGSLSATESHEIILSENPTDGNVIVKSFLLADGAEVNVYDMNAKKVYGSTVPAGTTEKLVRLNNVPAGTYLLVVMGRNRSASTKLVVR